MEAASPLAAGHIRILGTPVAPNEIKTSTLTARPYSASATPRLESRLKDGGGAARCVAASGGLVAEVERELAEEAGEEMGRWVEKCCCGGGGGGEGVVELLECLEKEAIMGEDDGKEPGDYNRRARIFERSSRIFQALRETEAATATATATATAAPPCSEIT